jgi:hypothetical protein
MNRSKITTQEAGQFDGCESNVETGKTTGLTAGTGEMLMQSA